MAEKSSQDVAAKQRIITHMNNDHHDSVVRYLEHFHKLSSSKAYDGRMTDIDLNSLTISCQGKSYRIPFSPPLTSLSQARERVVELDKKARTALGRSDVTVKEFTFPSSVVGIGAALITFAGYVLYSQRWWFEKGQIVEQVAGSRFAELSYKYQPYFLPGLLAIHFLESAVFSLSLRKHSVNPRTSAFWLWLVSAVVEGRPAIERFNSHVKTLRSKQKH